MLPPVPLGANLPPVTLPTLRGLWPQVYGPRDNLFMPNILEAAGSGLLRIFASSTTGYGRNRVCFTHVDNYAHGLIIAERALYANSPALGGFYIVTDGATHPDPAGFGLFWEVVDSAVTRMGFPSLWGKFKLPSWLMYPVSHVCNGPEAEAKPLQRAGADNAPVVQDRRRREGFAIQPHNRVC